MENSSNDSEQAPKEVGSNLSGAAVPVRKTDHQGQHETDPSQQLENTDALIGDVDPTVRDGISQEQKNGDAQDQSESDDPANES